VRSGLPERESDLSVARTTNGMDVREIVSRREPQNQHLVYVPDASDTQTIVEHLVGMANSEGGSVVVGVEVDEGGKPVAFADIERRGEIAGQVEREIEQTVEPVLESRVEQFRVGDPRLIAFTVPPSRRLRSVQDARIEKPVFPARTGTSQAYVSGRDLEALLRCS